MKRIIKIVLTMSMALSIMLCVVFGDMGNRPIGLDGRYKGSCTSIVSVNNTVYVGTDVFELLGLKIEENQDKTEVIIRNSGNKEVCHVFIPDIKADDKSMVVENNDLYVSLPKAAAILKLEYETEKGAVSFYTSKAKKSQIHFDKGLLKMNYPARFASLKGKTDAINTECEKLDNGGPLDEKKLKVQFESILKASRAMRKDVSRINAEDSRMKTAKNMLISGFEMLESAMADLRKVTITKDLGLFGSYQEKIKKAIMLYSDGWTIITEGL